VSLKENTNQLLVLKVRHSCEFTNRKGYFCPTFTEKYECPQGHYCPIGSYEPHVCTQMTSCPPKSNTSLFYGAVIVIFIVDGFLVGSFFLYRFYLKKKNAVIKTGGKVTFELFLIAKKWKTSQTLLVKFGLRRWTLNLME
jgi:hypothetical protein